MVFGAQIRKWRLSADLTQRELAERAGLDFTYLSKIEASVVAPPSDEKVRALARALHLDRNATEELVDLAHQTKLPAEIVKAALIRNPEVGALLRRLKDQRLSDDEIAAMRNIAARGSKTKENG